MTDRPQLVVFTGLQGSGKSSFYRSRMAATHVLVSKDLMRNARNPDARQQRLVAEALQAGRSVVVDNTSPSRGVRAPLVMLGRALGARVVSYWFDTPVRDCVRRNAGRSGRARVPDVAIFATLKRMEPPSVDEGFDEVWRVRPSADGTLEVQQLSQPPAPHAT